MTQEEQLLQEIITRLDKLSNATYQPVDSDLTAIAALTTTAFGRSLLTMANAAAVFTTLGMGTIKGELKYLELDLDSTDFGSWNGSPITMFPAAPPAGKYYDIEELIFEFNPGTTPYNVGAGTRMYISDEYGSLEVFSATLDVFGQGEKTYIKFNKNSVQIIGGIAEHSPLALPTQWSVSADADFTLGDGTGKFKIWYYERTHTA